MQKQYPEVKQVACLNGFVLKIIAIIIMLIDHIGYILYPEYPVFRYIGRLAFPIFCFLLVEGFINTKNIRKYELRLLIFAFISEIPFDLAFHNQFFYFKYQNVFFTLFLGVVMLDIMSRLRQHMVKYDIWVELLVLLLFMLVAFGLFTDYSGGGVLLIYCFYKFRNNQFWKLISLFLICLLFYGGIELYGVIAFIPMLLYNGKRSRVAVAYSNNEVVSQIIRYLFYIFYPVHLIILHLIFIFFR